MANPASAIPLTSTAWSSQVTTDAATLIEVQVAPQIAAVTVLAVGADARVQVEGGSHGGTLSTSKATVKVADGGGAGFTPRDCGLGSNWWPKPGERDHWRFWVARDSGDTTIHLVGELK